MEIDIVAIDPAEVPQQQQRSMEMVTEKVRKTAAPLDFRFKGGFTVAPGSTEQAALRKAMQSADEELSDVFFVLKTQGRTGPEREIGQGFLNLKQLLTSGKDTVGQVLTLQPPPGSAPEGPGKLTVSLFAIEALNALDAPSSGGASAAPPDTVLVEIGKLALRPVPLELDLLQLPAERLHLAHLVARHRFAPFAGRPGRSGVSANGLLPGADCGGSGLPPARVFNLSYAVPDHHADCQSRDMPDAHPHPIVDRGGGSGSVWQAIEKKGA